MNRQEKLDVVSQIKEQLTEAGLVLVTKQSGLTVSESSELRSKIREAGASFKVSKNTLSRIAVKDTPFEGITELLKGPTALAISVDPVAAAKAVVDFSKDNEKLEVLGGVMQGQVLDQAGVKALAKLPSLDELRATLVAMIQTPATRVAGVTQAPAGQLARVFGAYGSKA